MSLLKRARGQGHTEDTKRPVAGSFHGSLTVLFAVSTVFFLNSSSRQVLAPILPAVEADLGIGHAQAGSLFLLLTAGYGAGLLCSGFVSERLSHRGTIGLSSAGIGLMMFVVAAGHSLWELRIGLLILGGAAGLYLPSGIATITSRIAPGAWGKALAFHELGPNLAFALTPMAAEALLGFFSWRGVLAAFGVPALVAGAAVFSLRGTGGNRGTPLRRAALAPLVANPTFWLLVALFSLGIGLAAGVYSMLPLYLTAGLGFERARANHLVAFSRVLALATVVGAGWFSDRAGPRRALIVTMIAGGVATALIGLGPRSTIVLAILIQPMITACTFPAVFAALAATSPAAVAFAAPLAMLLGGGGVPAAIGALAERGLFREAFVLVGGLAVTGAFLAAQLNLVPSPSAGVLRNQGGTRP